MIPAGGRFLSDQEYSALAQEMNGIIATSHLFKSLDGPGRESVLECGYVQNFSEGDVLMQQGKPGAVMFMVLNGSVSVATETPGGVVQLADLGRGACVGEVSVLSGGPRTATVTATTDVDVVAFAAHRIERVLAEYPKVRSVLEKLVESRAQDTIQKIIG